MVLPDGTNRFIVGEGVVELSAPSTVAGDETGRRLESLNRALAGEHPDWDDYHRGMVRTVDSSLGS